MGALLSKFLGFIFKKAVVKFWALGLLYFIVLDFVPTLISWVGADSLLNNVFAMFNSIPSGVGYFLSAFNLGFGLKIIISAYITRFLIRRIPVIG